MYKSILVILFLAASARALSVLECDPIREELQECDGNQVTCELTCDNYKLKHAMCPCEEKCVCKQQFVKDDTTGACLYRFQCPTSWWRSMHH